MMVYLEWIRGYSSRQKFSRIVHFFHIRGIMVIAQTGYWHFSRGLAFFKDFLTVKMQQNLVGLGVREVGVGNVCLLFKLR